MVSLWLPSFATDRLRRRQRGGGPASDKSNQPEEQPLATVIAGSGGPRLAAVNRSAEAGGVKPGLPLAHARAVLPGLETAAADPKGDHRALAALAQWAGRYTPWTAVDAESNGIWLDISGCAHLFGGETVLMADLSRRLRRLGYENRVAAADTPGAAWAVARFAAKPGKPVLVPPGEQAEALPALPVAALRLEPEAVEGLARMGLRRIGDLTGVARAPLTARFGPLLLQRLDQALGRTDESIEPHRPLPSLRTRLAFAEPISQRSDIDAALAQLLDALCRQLSDRRLGARGLRLTGYRTDATTFETAIGTSRPVRDADHLDRLFRNKLDDVDAGFGIEVMILAATATDALDPAQAALGHDGSDGMSGHAGVTDLIDRLGNRLGPKRVLRLEPRASHLPERASRPVSALAHTDTPAAAFPGSEAPGSPRPVRLLPTPEPIEVMAPVPDHPPVMFRWRRAQHRIARADGPERIGPEWWLEPPRDLASGQSRLRDYYRIEDTEGVRFWVYRAGPYHASAPPRWYLHGFFP